MSDHITVFCKFQIPQKLGIVSIDSDENDIKAYIKRVIAEFDAENADFISWSEFHGSDSNHEHQPSDNFRPATYVEIMVTLDKDELNDPDKRQMIDKALAVLRGQSIQIVHSSQNNNTCHIGFTQL